MTTTIQRSGSRGEISPDFWYRPDIAPWHSGFKKCRNFYTKKQGNVENRGGLQFVGEFENSANPGVLVTFPLTSTQQYVLEFTNQLLRFYYQGAYVSDSSVAITAFANGSNPAISTSGGGGINWAVGDSIYITGATGPMAQFINNRLFLISAWNNSNPGTLKLTTPDGTNLDSTTWGSVILTNAVVNHVFQITTPYLTADLAYLKFAPFQNTMKIRNQNYSRYILTFYSPSNWGLTIDNAWPAQIPAAMNLQGSAGSGSGVNYYYKVATLNLLTGEESFCGTISAGTTTTDISVSAITGTVGSKVYNFAATSHGLSTGNIVTVDQDVFFVRNNTGTPPTPPVFKIPLFNIGTNYAVTVIDSNNFTAVGLSNYGGSINKTPNTSNVSTIAPANGQKINAVTTGPSGTNTATITTAGNHGLSTGDEVLIQNTGIYGFDNVLFNVTKISNTVVSLNGVNGTNYAAWGGVSGTIAGTQLKIPCDPPTNSTTNNLSWAVNPSQGSAQIYPVQYLVYLSIGLPTGPYGFIGAVNNPGFNDPGIVPNYTRTPLTYTPIFVGTANQPGSACFYEQRAVEFSTQSNPQLIAASVVDYYNNFGTHDPLLSNDAINGTLATNQITQIFDALDMGYLVLMTDVGPFMCTGDPATNSITPLPGGLGAKKQAYPGGAQIPSPISSNKNILYVLKDGSTVYSLKVLQTLWGSYIGDYDDMSLLSFHLTKNDPIVRWAYQELPHRIFWMVTQSGKIRSLTYDDKNGITAWAEHDTLNGIAESVTCAQEGNTSAIYFTIKRTINGLTKRYVERLVAHDQSDYRFYNFMDCSNTYDGTQWAGKAVNITFTTTSSPVAPGQPGYFDDTDPNVIATAGSSIFTASMVGQTLQFPGVKDANGNPLSFEINSYTSGTVVGVVPSAQVAPAQQGVPLSGSVLAIQTVYGLWNLEGQAISAFADGYEALNGLTDQNPTVVTNGAVTLDEPYGVISIGLPITADLETLPFDIPQNGTVIDQKKMFNKVNVGVYDTRGLFIGPQFPNLAMANPVTGGLTEMKLKTVEQGYYQPTGLTTGAAQEIVQGAWRFKSTVCLRQVGPEPATISTIAPSWKE